MTKRKGQRAREPRDQRDLGDRPPRPIPQTPGQERKTGLVQATRLRDTDHGPQGQPPGQRAHKPQPRHPQRRQRGRPDQHLAAQAPVHQPPAERRQSRHDQKPQRWPQRQFALAPACRHHQIRQQRRERIIAPRIDQRLPQRQEPDRRSAPLCRTRLAHCCSNASVLRTLTAPDPGAPQPPRRLATGPPSGDALFAQRDRYPMPFDTRSGLFYRIVPADRAAKALEPAISPEGRFHHDAQPTLYVSPRPDWACHAIKALRPRHRPAPHHLRASTDSPPASSTCATHSHCAAADIDPGPRRHPLAPAARPEPARLHLDGLRPRPGHRRRRHDLHRPVRADALAPCAVPLDACQPHGTGSALSPADLKAARHPCLPMDGMHPVCKDRCSGKGPFHDRPRSLWPPRLGPRLQGCAGPCAGGTAAPNPLDRHLGRSSDPTGRGPMRQPFCRNAASDDRRGRPCSVSARSCWTSPTGSAA
jgi:hypothetical protein